jgi:hypothetical protein
MFADALGKAVSGIEATPTLASSDDPSEQVIEAYGPLVEAVTHGLFYALIDLKLLTGNILEPYVPGYKAFLQAME